MRAAEGPYGEGDGACDEEEMVIIVRKMVGWNKRMKMVAIVITVKLK